MRVGIATWFRDNYGSVLQAYALHTLVKDMGHEPVLLQYDSSGGLIRKIRSRIRILGPKRVCSQYAALIKGRISTHREQSGIQTRKNAIEAFINENLNLSERVYTPVDFESCLDEADAFICGSDQVWNPAIADYSPFYWLSFVPSDVPKISYAPSMGMPKLQKRDEEFIVAQLNSFSAASVRESRTAEMLNNLNGLTTTVKTVVDPTLLLPREKWEEMCSTSRVSQDNQDYLFAYLLRGSFEQRAFCAEIARSRGLKLVVYPCLEAVPQGRDVQGWGDIRVFDDGPAEFLARIKGASLVITDSFHCTLFSIMFEKDFYVLRKTFDTASQTTRIDELLSVSNLKDRVLEELSLPAQENDCKGASDKISLHAQASRAYFERAMRGAECQLAGNSADF